MSCTADHLPHLRNRFTTGFLSRSNRTTQSLKASSLNVKGLQETEPRPEAPSSAPRMRKIRFHNPEPEESPPSPGVPARLAARARPAFCTDRAKPRTERPRSTHASTRGTDQGLLLRGGDSSAIREGGHLGVAHLPAVRGRTTPAHVTRRYSPASPPHTTPPPPNGRRAARAPPPRRCPLTSPPSAKPGAGQPCRTEPSRAEPCLALNSAAECRQVGA